MLHLSPLAFLKQAVPACNNLTRGSDCAPGNTLFDWSCPMWDVSGILPKQESGFLSVLFSAGFPLCLSYPLPCSSTYVIPPSETPPPKFVHRLRFFSGPFFVPRTIPSLPQSQKSNRPPVTASPSDFNLLPLLHFHLPLFPNLPSAVLAYP